MARQYQSASLLSTNYATKSIGLLSAIFPELGAEPAEVLRVVAVRLRVGKPGAASEA